VSIENAPYRGFIVLENDSNEQIKAISPISNTNTRPLWFLYSGINSYWPGMGQQLIRIPEFKSSFEECAKAVEPFGIDLFDILRHPKEDEEIDIVIKMVFVTAMNVSKYKQISIPIQIQMKKILLPPTRETATTKNFFVAFLQRCRYNFCKNILARNDRTIEEDEH
jgi:hypothetical protein